MHCLWVSFITIILIIINIPFLPITIKISHNFLPRISHRLCIHKKYTEHCISITDLPAVEVCIVEDLKIKLREGTIQRVILGIRNLVLRGGQQPVRLDTELSEHFLKSVDIIANNANDDNSKVDLGNHEGWKLQGRSTE